MAGGATGALISSPSSPDRGVPGAIGRLLHRTAGSKTTSKRFHRRDSNSAVGPNDLLQSERDETPSDPTRSCAPAVAASAEHPLGNTAPDAGDIAQPQPQQTGAKPTATAAPTPMPTPEMPSATPQPQLKKKASFRDRLKAWQKPPQRLEIVTEESKPRFVYEPTHAAADFSRLAVSPLSPPRKRVPAERDPPLAPRASHRRSMQGGEEGDSEPARRHSRSGTNRHSYTLVEDPFHASNAAAHVPVNSRPVSWVPEAQAPRDQDPPPSQPLSDYELFIARAEAEDRERREQILRSISQRSAAYSANRVRPDPHRQFAAKGSSSAGRAAERSDKSAPRNTSNRDVFGTGNGTEKPLQKRKQRQDGPKGHARQSSWAPSYATSGSAAAEKVADKRTPAPPQSQASAQKALTPEQPKPTVYMVENGSDPAREYQPQSPRTLRRQASLTQRLVQYIRPPKTVRPVETLVE